jgi:hypothetical protein
MRRPKRRKTTKSKKQRAKKSDASTRTSKTSARKQKDGDSGAKSAARMKRASPDKSAAEGTENTITSLEPKVDMFKNRTVYKTVNSDGKAQYLPQKGQATKREVQQGLFVKDSVIEGLRPDAASSKLAAGKTKWDHLRGRKMYPSETTDAAGETVIKYFPRESDATDQEANAGYVIRDSAVNASAADGTPNKLLDKGRKYDIRTNRYIYPTTGTNDKGEPITLYFPRESDAKSHERVDGYFVKDTAVDALETDRAKRVKDKDGSKNAANSKRRADRATRQPGVNKPSDATRADIGKKREVFETEVAPNVKKFVPKKEQASALELRLGLYRDGTGVENDAQANGQGRRDVGNAPFLRDDDGVELWDGSRIPQPDQETQKGILKGLKPRYDLVRQRQLYPVEIAPNKIKYMPLASDAAPNEIRSGNVVAMVPKTPLTKLLRMQEASAEFMIDGRLIKAFSLAAIKEAVADTDNFVLRSRSYQKDLTETNPTLQQQWVAAPANQDDAA